VNPTDPKPEPLRVGATKLFPAGVIQFQEYPSGETGIEVITDKRKRRCYIATVSLVPYGAPSPGVGGVWIKGWSENEGVPQALELAGVVRLTGRTHRAGFVIADHGELTERALQVRDHQLHQRKR
jgi:hypothetical protein